MQFDNLSSLIIDLLILLLAAGVYLAFYLNNLAKETSKEANKLSFETIRRADLLPLLIESLKKYFSEESFSTLIELRNKAIKADLMKGEKAQAEQLLLLEIQRVLEMTEGIVAAKQDLQLAAFKKDFAEADNKVNQLAINYNNLVKRYNSFNSNLLFKPVSLLIKANKINSF